jgi:hypothetical protein
LTFEGDLTSPKATLKISNQNALLSLMSQDDMDSIKNQIHSRINRIVETKEEDDDEENKRIINEDEEGEVIQERHKKT